MDKLITAVTIVVVLGLFYTLSMSQQKPQQRAAQSHVWAATVKGQTIGSYANYHNCVAAVKSQVDVSQTPYDCTLIKHP